MNRKKEGDFIKNFICKWWSVFLLCLFIILGVSVDRSTSLIDYVFEFIGIRPWSGGTHIAGILSILIICISIILVDHLTHRKYGVKWGKILLIIFAVCFIFFKLMVNYEENKMSRKTGFQAVEFITNRDGSSLSCNILSGKYPSIQGKVTLKNYGHSEVYLFLKVPVDSKWGKGDNNIKCYEKNGGEKGFILKPGETREICIYEEETDFRLDYNYGDTYAYTNFDVDEIIIYDENESLELFKKRKGFIIDL